MLLQKKEGIIRKTLTVLIGIGVLALLSIGVFAPSSVLGVSTVTVRGNVNKVIPGPTLAGVANQQVSVVCGGVTKSATTNASGLYTATFMEAGCNPFSMVSAKSTYNGSIITRQVFVSSEGRATIDLNF